MCDYLPLSGERAVTSWDTEEECIVISELRRGEDRVIRFRRGMEFCQDFIAESLCDPGGRISRDDRAKLRGR